MTKVCHLTSTHGNHDQRILIKECCSLVKAGYDVYQVAQGESGEFNGVHLIGTGENNKKSSYRLIRRPYEVYRIAKKLDADIYQIHDFELLPYAVKLKKSGKKVIFDYHEDFASRFADTDVFHLPKSIMKFFGKMYCRYEKKSIAKLDAMISVTPHICERLRLSNPNTYMITNYPITDENNPWASKEEYNSNSHNICFAGQISCVQYALDCVVKAIQNIPDIKLFLYGNERRNGDIDYLKSLDTNSKVEYKGTLPYNEVPKAISNSLAAIVTAGYTKDTFGHYGTLGNNKLFEAMLRGVPVIFTDFELWLEINNENEFGIPVEQGNVKDMEKAIDYIINNPDIARQMGNQGRKAIFEKYNWCSQEKILFELYESLKK